MDHLEKAEITLQDLQYDLPDSSIARYPQGERGSSRLLVYNGAIQDSQFSKLSDFLPSNSMLVFNNTRVINARIEFQRNTGARIEVFCLEPHHPKDISHAFQSRGGVEWNCLIGNLKKWKEEEALVKTLIIGGELVLITAYLVKKLKSSNIVHFEWDNSNYTFSEILEGLGKLPIPPYLERETEEVDKDRYQTVYSVNKGSVAAPTAGLHFTKDILIDIKNKGHLTDFVTLHVGAGTFKPIKENAIEKHEMHKESLVVQKKFVEQLLSHQASIIAVGTTAVRTIESLYWLGVKLLNGDDDMLVAQWMAYEDKRDVPTTDSLKALLNYMVANDTTEISAETAIMIKPGYKFRLVNGIITNFHQPESTLLLLVSAFIGYKNCMTIYSHAIKSGYKFLSYGDSSLLYPHT